MSLVTTRVATATNATWLTLVFWKLSAQYKIVFRPVFSLRWSYARFVHMRGFSIHLTLEAASVFDDDGPSAARLLLSLGHALTSLVVRVICGVDCHLLLNHPKT